jgi:hypothetical protein
MSRTTSTQLLAVTVLLLTAALVIVVALRWSPSPRDTTVQPFSYWDVSRIHMTDSSGSLTLSRDGSSWFVGDNRTQEANTEQIRGLIGRWTDGFRPLRPAPSTAQTDGLESFGLGTDGMLLELMGNKESHLVRLELGKRLRGGRLYVRVPPTGEVMEGVLPPGPAPSTRPGDWTVPPSR